MIIIPDMRKEAFARLSVLVGACLLAGCNVESRWGDSSLPVDLRSSSDLRRPAVGEVAPRSGASGWFAPITSGVGEAWRFATGARFSKDVDLLDAPDANVRRDAIFRVASARAGANEPYRAVYRALASTDPDPLVRAAALRAVNLTRDPEPESKSILLTALTDGSDTVRLEALKALGNIPPDDFTPVRAIASDVTEPIDLRIAAADVLRHDRSLAGARALVGTLEDPQFGLAWQSRRSLYLMTDRDYRYSVSQWLEFVASAESGLR